MYTYGHVIFVYKHASVYILLITDTILGVYNLELRNDKNVSVCNAFI